MPERLFKDERVATVTLRRDTRSDMKEKFPELVGYIAEVKAEKDRNFGCSGDGVFYRSLLSIGKTADAAVYRLTEELGLREEADERKGRIDISEDSVWIYDADGEEVVYWTKDMWIKDPTIVSMVAEAIDSFYRFGIEFVKQHYVKEVEIEPKCLPCLDRVRLVGPDGAEHRCYGYGHKSKVELKETICVGDDLPEKSPDWCPKRKA